MSKYTILKVLSLNKQEEQIEISNETYIELKMHTVLALPIDRWNTLVMSDDLRKSWREEILSTIYYNCKYENVQKTLPIGVPYVILKGTSAAKYYPHPEYRTMGDIDIMTCREDYDQALEELLSDGYRIIDSLERETSLEKNGIVIELHKFFASLNELEQAQYLDELIIRNINATHILPDLVNGLTLLEHISQHLERGIGLRQIVDWLMFANCCLSDETWAEFYVLSRKIGLDQFAIIITRMCEIYLGLPERKWSSGADDGICHELMEYILQCGNFGNKRNYDSDAIHTVLYYTSGPLATIKLLQERGLENWESSKKHVILRPFAWSYQICRYIVRGLKQKKTLTVLKQEYMVAKKKKSLFNKLGVRMKSKGLVVYRNGKYIKT